MTRVDRKTGHNIGHLRNAGFRFRKACISNYLRVLVKHFGFEIRTAQSLGTLPPILNYRIWVTRQ
jgi:hypothetical protein